MIRSPISENVFPPHLNHAVTVPEHNSEIGKTGPGLQSLILRTQAAVVWSTDLPLLLGCCCCCCCGTDRQMDGKTPDQRFKPMIFAKDTASVIYSNNDQTSNVERHKKMQVCRFTVFLLFMLSSFHIAPMCCESELLVNSSAYRRYRRLGQDIT